MANSNDKDIINFNMDTVFKFSMAKQIYNKENAKTHITNDHIDMTMILSCRPVNRWLNAFEEKGSNTF